jgi:hypothetical protein
MTLRNVPKSHTLEQQRLEINEIAVDLDTAVDGTKTFGGSKTFSSDVTFSSTVDFDGIATFNSSPTFSDGVAANFGDGADLRLYHDGTTTTNWIQSNGLLNLQSLGVTVTSWTNLEKLADFNLNGSVDLYYDGAKKIATSLTGATVLGDLEVNDELHSASGTFILKTADQITPGQMVTEAVFGGSMYVPYGFSTYPITYFPGGGISETSTNDGVTIQSGGSIFISNSGGSAVWKGRQTGTAGITSEIDAPGNATFAGTLDVSNTVTFNGDVTFTGVANSLFINPSTTFNNNAAFANDKVLNFGGSSNGRILYVSATNSFDVRVPGGSEDLKLGAGTAVRITNENGLTDRAVFDSSGLTVSGTVDATGFSINGSPFSSDVATTSAAGIVQPDGTTIAIDGSGVISVAGGGDPFTADGFKFGVNEGSGPAATQGEIRQISGRPHFYDGSAWQEFILGSTQQVTIPAETDWDKVLLRSTFDSDFNDVKFGAVGVANTYTTYQSQSVLASTRVGTPAKFGTNVLKSVGNGVIYPDRAEYDFDGPFTMECWVYFDSMPAGYTQAFYEKHVIFSKSNSTFTNGSWQLYVKKASNNNHFWYMDVHDTASNTEEQLTLDSAGQTFDDFINQWVHLALVKESDGSLHLYVNGEDGLYTWSSTVSGNNITNNSFPLAIGVPQENQQAINDIFIDDVRITKDARYTTNGIYGTPAFTPPTTAHPVSGSTTTYTPPATSKAGEIVLGATPTWTGTLGVSVAQQSSGNYRLTFTSPFTNATDYYVIVNHMDGSGPVEVVPVRSAAHIDFAVTQSGSALDTGSLAIQVIAH